jgi:CheY-like chemotaxis protein
MTTQVLVVDDVPALAEQYAYDLKRVGKYDAIVAAGGAEALDILAREPIDCVVLDLEMPGTDGFEVLRSLQQRGIETPVIVYTGAGSFDPLRSGCAAGCVWIRRQSGADRTRRSGNRKRGLTRTHGERAAIPAFPIRRRDRRLSATARPCGRFARRSPVWRRFQAES